MKTFPVRKCTQTILLYYSEVDFAKVLTVFFAYRPKFIQPRANSKTEATLRDSAPRAALPENNTKQ